MNQLEFRNIKASDYNALEAIINETWGYERFCSKKIAKRMAKLYLASCLANQTFTCVALSNGEPVGIIMGKKKSKFRPKIRYALRQMVVGSSMFLSKESRTVIQFFGRVSKLDEDLLKETKQEYDGEVAFFAIKSNQRGKGTGKALWERLLTYMKQAECQKFFLYTDTSCNYGFYEHQGMVRKGEKVWSLKPYANEEMHFFIYEYVN